VKKDFLFFREEINFDENIFVTFYFEKKFKEELY